MRPDLGLFMVCDGMGNYSAGEVLAASIIPRTIREVLRALRARPRQHLALQGGTGPLWGRRAAGCRSPWGLANSRIRQAAQGDSKKHNMGTTVVAAFLGKEKSYIAHAGDSRAYLFRDGTLSAITADHSLLGEFIRSQHPSPQEIQAFPYKNVINRALGPAAEVKVEARAIDMKAGDTLLLCCDGLHGMVSDEVIAALLKSHPDLEEACRALVDRGMNTPASGVDNVTSCSWSAAIDASVGGSTPYRSRATKSGEVSAWVLKGSFGASGAGAGGGRLTDVTLLCLAVAVVSRRGVEGSNRREPLQAWQLVTAPFTSSSSSKQVHPNGGS